MSVLNTAMTGLRTAQTLINTTSNNIANANTEGYIVQRVDVKTQGSLGYQTGVQVDRIRRDVPLELQNQMRTDGGRSASSAIYSAGATRIDGILGDVENGLNSVMNNFFDASISLNQNPESIAIRQSFISQAQTLASRVNQMGAQLEREETFLRNQMQVGAQQLNELAAELVQLNKGIAAGSAGGATPPLQLMDQRDQVLTEMSELAGVDVFPAENNQVSVYLSGGSVLVSGQNRLVVDTQPSASDPSRLQLVLKTNDTEVAAIPNSRLDGTLGGLNNLLDEVVLPARNELGLIAMGISDAVNQTLSQGLDLNGQYGAPLFDSLNSSTFVPGRAVGNLNNTGTGVVTVTIEDTQQLTAKDYSLRIGAGNTYSLTDGSGTSLASGTLGATDTTISIDGIEIQLGAAASFAQGDSFGVQPTRRAAEGLRVVLTEPRALALAAPVVAQSGAANVGTGEAILNGVLAVDGSSVFTTSPAGMSPELLIEVTGPGAYAVKNAGTGATQWTGTYTVGQPFEPFSSDPLDSTYTGFTATISGTPSVGDTFNFDFNAGGTGDNRNARALADLQTTSWLEGGSRQFNEVYGGLVSKVGSQAALGQITAEANKAIYDASIGQLGDLAGVNLDEEAANLVRYQQYYQATAQVISVSNDLFDTLLGSLR